MTFPNVTRRLVWLPGSNPGGVAASAPDAASAMSDLDNISMIEDDYYVFDVDSDVNTAGWSCEGEKETMETDQAEDHLLGEGINF